MRWSEILKYQCLIKNIAIGPYGSLPERINKEENELLQLRRNDAHKSVFNLLNNSDFQRF